MHRRALLLALSLISGAIVHGVASALPLPIFTDLGLTSQQIAAIDAGRPVAKVLSWGGPSEVYVFGAVHVEGSPDTYLEAARDVGRLSGTPGYQGIGEIREDATVADLSALCVRPGRCEGAQELPRRLVRRAVAEQRDSDGFATAWTGRGPMRRIRPTPSPVRRCCNWCRRIDVAATRRSANIGTSSIPRVSPTSSR